MTALTGLIPCAALLLAQRIWNSGGRSVEPPRFKAVPRAGGASEAAGPSAASWSGAPTS